jgi:hypothetical protein
MSSNDVSSVIVVQQHDVRVGRERICAIATIAQCDTLGIQPGRRNMGPVPNHRWSSVPSTSRVNADKRNEEIEHTYRRAILKAGHQQSNLH